MNILKNASAVTTGNAEPCNQDSYTYQATVSGTGAVTATVVIEVSNNGQDWLTLDTLTLSGTTRASAGSASAAPWDFIRARVSAISGTNAVVNVDCGGFNKIR